MTDWSEEARRTIEAVAATIPDDAPMKERKAIISAAYPFDGREHWPYKAWLKATKAYFAKYEPKKDPFPGLRRDPVTGRPIIA
jgi:hypothetical protein